LAPFFYHGLPPQSPFFMIHHFDSLLPVSFFPRLVQRLVVRTGGIVLATALFEANGLKPTANFLAWPPSEFWVFHFIAPLIATTPPPLLCCVAWQPLPFVFKTLQSLKMFRPRFCPLFRLRFSVFLLWLGNGDQGFTSPPFLAPLFSFVLRLTFSHFLFLLPACPLLFFDLPFPPKFACLCATIR